MTRYFAQNTPRAGLEHMMMSVPGFQKRGGGMMILSRFCYKPEDVDCRYCLHYRRRSCQVRTCPYIAERLKSGAIEYLDLILEYFGHIPHAGLHKRIQAVEHWSGPDQAVLHTVSVHLRSRFADRVWDDAPPGYLAALYLLASKERLWQPALSALSHDSIDFSCIVSKPHGFAIQDYPILSDLYKLIEQEYREYDGNCHQLYTAELLQEILLGLHSMCQGAEAQFFNGHTNVTSSRFIVFGVKGLLQASKNVRGAMLFNILSYMSDRLLTIGNTTAALDELYVWLSDNVSVGTTIIEYIRNTLKRVRKKESNLIMASQNLEDFDREGIRELTKPLFAIPPHQFIFNCGSIDKRFYMDLLQLEEAEYNLIRFPQRGVCLFKCGNERYLLEVHAPAYKEALFGTAGGR